jgi:hypothetical protein
VDAPAEATWSTAVGEADWIGERLSPFDAHQVTSVVPAGFEAYARVLHPAAEPDRDGGDLVRWAEVAAWSGLPLRPDAQFHSIALPPSRPARPAPWSGQGPEQGNLYLADAQALTGLVGEWTTTPGHCWFCVWDGYDWAGTLLTPPGETAARLPDPVPATVWRGPRVHLPCRDYLLYTGPVAAVSAAAAHPDDTADWAAAHPDDTADWPVTPNLWWPADRAWCVATEIDLSWTYVGGPAGLIAGILGDERLEALPAEPGDPLTHVEAWVTSWVDEATTQLLASGQAVITTSRGTVQATLDCPSRFRHGGLRTSTEAENGVSGSGWVGLSHRDGEELREEISLYLTLAVIGLVGG